LGGFRDLSTASGARLLAALKALPDQIEEILAAEDRIAAVARSIATASDAYFVGARLALRWR